MGKLKINLDFSLKRLDLAIKGHSEKKFLGSYKSAFKGQGLEFEDYRKYISGTDDASLIDWKASKRVNDLMIKEFVEERNIDVIFLVDVSSQMLTGSTDRLKAEYVAELVTSFGYNVLSAGDAVGLVLFSDKIVKFIPPQSGMKQYFALTKTLSEPSFYKGYSDIGSALRFAFNQFSKNSLVILVSDFIYGLETEKLIKLCSMKFDLITAVIRDPVDMDLPEGVGEVSIRDPYSGRTVLIDPTKIKEYYAAESYGQVKEIEELMKKSGADFLFLRTNEPFVKHLTEFFKKRQEKWR